MQKKRFFAVYATDVCDYFRDSYHGLKKQTMNYKWLPATEHMLFVELTIQDLMGISTTRRIVSVAKGHV